MKKKFYIDRQFGIAIFVDTENGIVTNVTNETERFCNKMLERYKDKEISFLKQDFEERMKPSYHNVRPLELTQLIQQEASIELRIRQAYNRLSSIETPKENIPAIEENIKEMKEKLYAKEKEIKEERKLLEEFCNYISS